jgi:hypothetical protein
MNDQELTYALQKSVEGARMSVPEEQIASRARAIRAGRRRRVAAGVTAAVSAGAAAVVATAFPPGPAAPAARDTAFVISHVTKALNAVPSDSVFHLRSRIGNSLVTDMWAEGTKSLIQKTTPSGRVVDESWYAATGTTITTVNVNARDKTWWRSAKPLAPRSAAGARAAAGPACDSSAGFPIPSNARKMAASLRTWVSCGLLTAGSTATVNGAANAELTTVLNGVTYTWYVDPATYLPTRMTTARPGILLAQNDFQWLPPTTANMAELNSPAAPQGYRQVTAPVTVTP